MTRDDARDEPKTMRECYGTVQLMRNYISADDLLRRAVLGGGFAVMLATAGCGRQSAPVLRAGPERR